MAPKMTRAGPIAGFRLTTGSEIRLLHPTTMWPSSASTVATMRAWRMPTTLVSGDPVLGNWVEHFPYQDGLLISYWDNSFSG